MNARFTRLVAIVTIATFAHLGCYNTYFISKDELEKLESGVEVKEVVTVQGDCRGATAANNGASEEKPKLAKAAKGGETETASDATSSGKAGKKAAPGCQSVPVSTANSIRVVLENNETRRVTPFNFMMSEKQLVSPEYDLLLSLKNVKGAKVREFSTWKTIGTIAGVSAVSVGTILAIGLTAQDPQF